MGTKEGALASHPEHVTLVKNGGGSIMLGKCSSSTGNRKMGSVDRKMEDTKNRAIMNKTNCKRLQKTREVISSMTQ